MMQCPITPRKQGGMIEWARLVYLSVNAVVVEAIVDR